MRSLFCVLTLSVLPMLVVADDLLIVNAKGYSVADPHSGQFEWMKIADGRVVMIGVGEAPAADKIIDLGGRTVLPGLIDAHGHILGLGQFRSQVDLVGSQSLEDALQRVVAQAGSGDGWLIGRGWNQELWPDKQFPTAADLDRIISDRPVLLSRVDGHAGWANSKAMAIAGVDRDTADPDDGAILRDAEGNPTGVFVDAAESLIENHVPSANDTAIRNALMVAQDELNRLGVTGVHDAGVDTQTLNAYRALADEGELSVRVYAMLSDTDENLDDLGEPLIGYGNDMLTARSVKIYVDGALGSRGAALLTDYDDDPGNLGLAFLDQAALERKIEKATDMGFQVGVHAIGDRGNRIVLDAYEATLADQDDARPRIEHAQVLVVEDIERFQSLGVIAAMQPTHATSDMNMAEDRVGPERIKGAYAWRLFTDQGAVIAAGSDFPVESANPFYGLHAAVTRRDHNGNPPGGWYPKQALTREEALAAFTSNAAFAAFQENQLGTLKPGMRADFIVIDRDYFEIDEDDIWQIQVEQTWLGGERVFDASQD